jgi:RNA polymerase sigma-70 factor (ECF subfamily)
MDAQGSPDAALVQRTQRGDREAYGDLVRRYAARIQAVCHARVGPQGPLEDLVQETFLKGYRAIGSLHEPERVGGWLYGIAVHTCLDWIRSRDRRHLPLGGEEPAAPGGGDPPIEQDEGKRRILTAVENLPEIYREVVMLFYYHRQTYEEMAALLGLSEAAINVRLTKARAMLRQ